MQTFCRNPGEQASERYKVRHRNPDSGIEDYGVWHAGDVEVVKL